MKIFSSAQIKDWDNYTITHEPVTSIELLERAAKACYRWLIENNFGKKSFKIFCGKGNNGGDGVAIARMLVEDKCNAEVYILETGNLGTNDFEHNTLRLHTLTDNIHFIESEESFPLINENDIVIDCLFGIGLNKPPGKIAGLLINHINNSNSTIVCIDMPSGMYADMSSLSNTIVKANYTLTFQQYKLAFLMAENEKYFGKIIVIDINLHKDFYDHTDAQFELIDIDLVRDIYKLRKPFSNKGNFGHACLIAGSYGMMGAAVMAAKACLKSGVGKLTCIVPKQGYDIIQISAPEAMCTISGNKFIKEINPRLHFNAIGIGPGIGMHKSHEDLLQNLFKTYHNPFIIDADGLNVLAENKKLLSSLSSDCIITPHHKEFDRLFDVSANDFNRMQLALEKSEEYKIYIVLKGHHTLIATPFRKGYFNSTGNAGMAKGGSGDVLTGILTGLSAQGYSSLEACLLGVYLHGMAGDIAAENFSQEAMTAADIIECLRYAFKNFTTKK